MFAEVLVNGVLTRTLIDTGSPATIISLDYALDLFAVKQKSGRWRP